MWSPLARKLLLAALPAMVILGIVASTIWGDNGLVMRLKLQQELQRAHDDLAGIQLENQQLRRDLELLDRDPRAVERLAAEELAWGAPDAVIYRFE
jgi:cell division protein FtsB